MYPATYTGRPARRADPFRPVPSTVPPGQRTGQRRMDRRSPYERSYEEEEERMGRMVPQWMGPRSAPEIFLDNIFSPSSPYEDDRYNGEWRSEREYMRGADYDRRPYDPRERDMYMGRVHPSDDSTFGVPPGTSPNSALTKRAMRARQQWMNGN